MAGLRVWLPDGLGELVVCPRVQQPFVRAHPRVVVPVNHLRTNCYVNRTHFVIDLKRFIVNLKRFIVGECPGAAAPCSGPPMCYSPHGSPGNVLLCKWDAVHSKSEPLHSNWVGARVQQALVRANPRFLVPVDHLQTVHYVNGTHF